MTDTITKSFQRQNTNYSLIMYGTVHTLTFKHGFQLIIFATMNEALNSIISQG